MRKLTPTSEEIEELRQTAPAGPLVAVNLLKFNLTDGGRAAYAKYMSAASDAMPEGVKILYTGTAGPDFGGGEDWDCVGIVEYPSADVFADFIMSQEYQSKAAPIRPQALERTLWLISFPKPMEEMLTG